MTCAEETILNEPLTRFIYDSDKVNTQGRVKDGAFLPSFEKNLNRLETSVCRIVTLDEEKIWHIGRQSRPERTIKGRADHSTEHVSNAGLTTVSAPEGTFEEHAVLLGWPEEKEQQKLIARAIAKASVGLITPK